MLWCTFMCNAYFNIGCTNIGLPVCILSCPCMFESGHILCVCVCVCGGGQGGRGVRAHVCVCVRVRACMHACVCMFACDVCLHVCLCIFLSLCLAVCLYVFKCLLICVHATVKRVFLHYLSSVIVLFQYVHYEVETVESDNQLALMKKEATLAKQASEVSHGDTLCRMFPPQVCPCCLLVLVGLSLLMPF